ncbi:MAG: helix-turn-helix domain-containing protein [Myxococcales bacterium FL481]|nr:MAG: helix-turn-helix domain-containing protein [Myxococcales bacterium FL481]
MVSRTTRTEREVTASRSDATTRATTATVGVLAYRGAQVAAVLGLVDLLEAASRMHSERGGRRGLAVEPLRGSSLTSPERPYAALVLPPSLGAEPLGRASPRLRSWLVGRHREGTVLCSVCVGAFLLADAGLLDGRPVTTHWAHAAELKRRHPRLEVAADRLLVDDGDIVTAGGVMAWIDLGLHLISRLLGPTTMLATARMFLVDPGGRDQRYYALFSPEHTHGDADVLRVQRWLRRTLSQPVSVDDMAAKARLGRRTFQRRFLRATGLNAGAYLQHLRVAAARELLERGDKTLEEVAWAVGYTDPGGFRRVFGRLMGLSPADYRRRFHAG